MSRRILKFKIPVAITFESEDEPRFLAVGWQGEDLVAWAEVTVGVGVRTTLAVAMTGDDVPADAEYVGTAQHDTMLGGSPFVAHVYARRQP